MAKWLQKLESYIGGGPSGPRRVKAFRWLVLVGLLGAALIIAASMLNFKTYDPSNPSGDSPPHDEDTPQQQTFLGGGDAGKNDPFADIEATLESRVKQIIEMMVGVGTADVLITVDSTEETVVQLNEKMTSQITDETDKSGAKRHITEVSRDGQVVLYELSGSQTPIVVKKVKPKVRGVLIVAKGAENAAVHRLIAEAVSRGIDVPIHRVSVVPRKS